MNLEPLEQVRKGRLDKIRELGIDPYANPGGYIRKNSEIIKEFEDWESPSWRFPKDTGPDSEYMSQGRIMLLRDAGGLLFAQIRDDTATIQIAISKKDVDEKTFKLSKLLDLGDIVAVNGKLRRTKTGEITIWAKSVNLVCKSLTHPPDKVEGIKDVELGYRKPYLKMAFDDSLVKRIHTRSTLIKSLRSYFEAEDFVEVETPMLHAMAGGAAAKPFATHLNCLNIPLYMRIAPELYLKRLIVGGMSKIFEINRNFRNEGIDATHNPEFTALEAYAIGETDITLYHLFSEILTNVVAEITEDEEGYFEYNGQKILTGRFSEYEYVELYKEATGRNFFDEKDKILANKIFEEKCESLLNPCHPSVIRGYPAILSPLTKTRDGDNDIAQRSDLFIAGMEIGTFYTEQNDPEKQYEAFTAQLSGSNEEESTLRTLDEDFIEALKVGMPPTGGFGIGIDRLVMLLTNQTSIRDVLAFPFMRPLATLNAEAQD